MALTFFPYTAGQLIKASDLNELIEAIQDGTIFVGTSFVGDLVSTLGDRVATLESKVAVLEAQILSSSQREQFQLTAGQTEVLLSKPPLIDSEILALNGLSLALSPLPDGTDADYTVSGTTITFSAELVANIINSDLLTVVYKYEVV